jgi:2-hydroxychromene-2-carboxylate isomerase
VLRHVWQNGGDANDPQRLAALTQRLAPRRDPNGDAVKNALRQATSQAVDRGVFGVPTVEVDGRLFWGVDGLPMLGAYLRGDAWFEGPAWDGAGVAPPGVQRRPLPPASNNP